MNGGIPKNFYKDVSYMINDFTVRGSKLISRYDQFKWLNKYLAIIDGSEPARMGESVAYGEILRDPDEG